MSVTSVPIVDLKNLCAVEHSPSESDWRAATEDLKEALQKIGFVYIRNHGVPQEKVTRVFDESVNFFGLPLETKQQYSRDFQATFHGYTKVGGERMTLDTSLELRETFDVALADQAEFSECPYPDQETPNFKPAMKELIGETKTLIQVLLKLIARALGLQDEEHFVPLHRNIEDSSIPNYTQLRTLFYPQVPEELGLKPGVVRCAEHTDYGTLTLLFQDAMGGLQIKSLQGDWVPATPIPGCILMNVGDLLDMWSGGLFPSSVHRVIVPEEEVKRSVPRQSVALFVKPDNSTLVYPLIKKYNEEISSSNDVVDLKHSGVFAGEHFVKRTIYHHRIAETAA